MPDGLDSGVYRSLFAAYPDALLLVDREGTIALANPAAAALLGYTPQELAGLPVDALVPDSIRPRHAAYREAYSHKPRPRPMGSATGTDLVAKRKDGSEVMVEIALSPLFEHGAPYVVAAVRGIGEYPRVQQALQRARYAEAVAQFGRLAVDTREPQALVAQVPKVALEALQADAVAVYLRERPGESFHLAAAAGRLQGEAPGDSVAQPQALPGAYREAGFTDALEVPVSDRGRVVGVLAVRALQQRFGEDETRFLESLSSLLATSLQRAQSEEALLHSQRLESVGQLTGGIAHDFNNLLTVISGNLQVLEDLPALQQDAFGAQLVAAATRATRRGAELTGKLLAFSRRQVLQPAAVDAVALVQSLAGMLRRTIDTRVRIEVDAAGATPPCLADPGQLESALLNIAINSRDAMPEGGTLSFRVAPAQPAEAGGAELPGPAADYVAVAIADTGTGMSEAVKERAFEPFFTTKESGRGTGLGLSTVYGFAKQSRGAVRLDSTPGMGTTVTLLLPIARGDEAAAEAHEGAAGAVPQGLRVLVVEDDAEVRGVVMNFLTALGCEATACENAESALAALDAADPDLLLTDIALGPGARGTELAREVVRRRPGLPVLLMSGYASGLLQEPAEWPLLRKPYAREDLAGAIAKALAAAYDAD